MHMRVFGVVESGRNPFKVRPEVLFHGGDQFSGQSLQIDTRPVKLDRVFADLTVFGSKLPN